MDVIAGVQGDMVGCAGVRSDHSDGDSPGDEAVIAELLREPEPPKLWIMRFLASDLVRDFVQGVLLSVIALVTFWAGTLLSDLLVHLNNK